MEYKREKYSCLFGEIQYCYFPPTVGDYPFQGLLIFMGSMVYKEYRGQGHFKEMVKYLLNEFPEGIKVQAPVSNKILIPMFERLGFKEVERIEYWEKLANSVMMEAMLDKDKLDLI